MPTPSDPASALDRYLAFRESLRSARIGRGGRDVCRRLTSSLDEAISELTGTVSDGMAVVAIGGYGRGEMSPHSDVDIMVLHSGGDHVEMAAALFRPLWDAKLRVGHSVRTLREASKAAKERFDTQTTLLTARLIAGDADLFDRLMDVVVSVTSARPLRRYLVAEERARREATPHIVMATNVKTGRGGLRTLHGFEWESRREELIGRFSSGSIERAKLAGETLIQIRNALHVVTGRPHDVFSSELREPVARWLGMDTFECAQALVEAMQELDFMATQRWPEVVEDWSGGVRRRLMTRSATGGVDRSPTQTELIAILGSGHQGQIALEQLWERGWLDDVLPEWGLVRSLPQLAPFHEHPVAAHLWRTVEEMRAIISEDGHFARVADELDDETVLLFAAFLHDIGKGQGDDHSVVGAEAARAFCSRIGLSAPRTRLVEGAVRHHLLLAAVATRRDIDAATVIDEVVDAVGSLQLLQLVYLLTAADSRATGPTMWGVWKATLVRTLFVRCAARFGGERSHPIGTKRDEIISAVPARRVAEVLQHLDSLPEDYLRSVSVHDVIWHLDLIADLEGPANIETRSGEPVERAVVVGSMQSEFRKTVAEVFAANGIDVLEARMFTRTDDMVVDTFRVRDDRTGTAVPATKWDSMRSDLAAGLAGQLDTRSKVAARAAAYRRKTGSPLVSGAVDESSGDLVVTIECGDQVGRLAEILTVLGECGLEIRLAKIDSRGGDVIDTFFVPGDHRDRGEVEALIDRVRRSLQQVSSDPADVLVPKLRVI